MVTICTTSLTFSNSTFCPYSVFMCFVWISEQTAIISLYSINWLVFITETECVYCAVRTGSLNVIQVNISVRSVHDLFKTSGHPHSTYSDLSPVCFPFPLLLIFCIICWESTAENEHLMLRLDCCPSSCLFPVSCDLTCTWNYLVQPIPTTQGPRPALL